MPRKNSLKTYIKGGHYHIYNRGVEKRIIYKDKKDYKVFLSYLKYSLSPLPKRKDILKDFTLQGLPFKGVPRLPINFHKRIELLAYCLMPNHFHLQIKQLENDSMKSFMASIMTRYSMYFNKKYNRVGNLFQGPYKAILIKDDAQLLHLSRYIHLNPSEHSKDIINTYSSYADYLKTRNTSWVKTDFILKFFNGSINPLFHKTNNYKDFVENYKQDSAKIIGKLALEDNL